jgi:hypothetical protein
MSEKHLELVPSTPCSRVEAVSFSLACNFSVAEFASIPGVSSALGNFGEFRYQKTHSFVA